ncbi:hypothetical protein EST38_g4802 [Candolleomyces aberdarensis]|uniref:Thiamin pyrophosphokinase thiamin-binding domain-containing protein n=1 Tax=Candolleomyces aberdarensis TaxID=2316362 RepID=A0A4Q2DLN7_9AGAR|nr:hypothetical protein EST38_g4802 [Candolleomyces aberdarensis]
MDPTSLALIALDLADIRKDKEEAFEYFLRAWHQAHVPSATMRLVSMYLPLNSTADLEDSDSTGEDAARGTTEYYLRCIGGSRGVAQLYLEAGLLHLEGAATTLLSASYSSLSSIRMPLQSQIGEGGTEAWKRDREAASKYFERARALQPDLDIPSLSAEGASHVELEIPSLDLAATSTPESVQSGPESLQTDPEYDVPTIRRRQKKRAEMEIVNASKTDLEEMDDTWLMYIPGTIMRTWDVNFLRNGGQAADRPRALIILNQPFSVPLFQRLWNSTGWHCCADGGANRLHDVFLEVPDADEARLRHLPDLIKGDFDSLNPDVRAFYASHGVSVIQDDDQDSTDLMKCIQALEEKELRDNSEVGPPSSSFTAISDHDDSQQQYDIVLLGGLAGRLDQTIHTLSYLHKLRKSRQRVYAVTDDNVGWVLDDGEHELKIDHDVLGPTCGLLPVGIDSTILSTRGLRWNLERHPSSFEGMVSTSNHLVPHEDVWVSTSKPIWWTAELRQLGNIG